MNQWIAFLFVMTFAGCATVPVTVHKITNPLFWDVEKDGTHSYVLATLEAGVGIEELPDGVLGKLHATKVLVLGPQSVDELAPTKKDLDGVKQALWLPEGDTLDKLISPQAWAILKEILHDRYGEETIKHWTPALAEGMLKLRRQTTLTYSNKPKKMGIKPVMMREELRALAKTGRYQVLYPITWQEYASELKRFCDAKCLEDYVLHPPADKKLTYNPEEVLANYRQGLEDKIAAEIDVAIQDEKRGLIQERFQSWAKHLEKMQKGYGSLFIAMPIGLLLGDGPTLLKSLAAEGFKVKRASVPENLHASN